MPQIQTVAVCDLGQMGAAVAVAFKRAGYRVLAWDSHSSQRELFQATAERLETRLDEQQEDT